MHFEILGEISDVETFAAGLEFARSPGCEEAMGRGRWRKRKGIARVRLVDGTIRLAKVHCYEAAGIGRKEYKIKHLL